MKKIIYNISILSIILLSSLIFTNLLHSANSLVKISSQTETKETQLDASELSAPTQEVFAQAIKKTNPEVVSIIISKDVPVINITHEHFPAGYFDITIPVYTQTGVVKQNVGAGSGFIINHDGYVLTNNHVVNDQGATYTVLLADGQEKPAQVIYTNPELDVAVIKIDGTYPAIATLGNSSSLTLNQPVAAIGNAYGKFTNSVSTGSISGFNKHIIANGPDIVEELTGLIETNTPITAGYSGGPLIDAKGNVIGINVAKDTNSSDSYSIPINLIKPAIQNYL